MRLAPHDPKNRVFSTEKEQKNTHTKKKTAQIFFKMAVKKCFVLPKAVGGKTIPNSNFPKTMNKANDFYNFFEKKNNSQVALSTIPSSPEPRLSQILVFYITKKKKKKTRSTAIQLRKNRGENPQSPSYENSYSIL